jgi:hypothetical protein
VRAGRLAGTIARPGYAWAKRLADELVTTGDLIEFKVGKAKPDGVFEGELEQAPLLEGAIVAIDNRTGAVLAMEGRRQLRTVAVQPRGAGETPGRLAVQAVRVHGRARQGLHGHVAAR